MRKLLCLIVLLMLVVIPAQAQDGGSVSVSCPGGGEITNAAEIIVNMRPGFTYTATVLGVDGFDPVMAVVNRGEVVECVEDVEDAADYTANLPTTGPISASGLNAQLPFSHNFNSFEDISLVVGGFGGQDGEFLVILEGMAVTARDGEGPGAGDPFTLRITENMIESPTNPSVYMLSTNEQLDPLMQVIDAEGEVVASCDDAGTQLCDENSTELTNAVVSRSLGRETPPRRLNAMLTLPVSGADIDVSAGFYVNFLMTSYQQATFGDYVVAFHVGVGDPEVATTDSDSDDGVEGLFGDSQDTDPTEVPDNTQNEGTVAGGGVDVTCPNGQEIVNGAEVIVNMRPGFTYTATAVGVNGFDPVLAVVNRGEVVNCNDDSERAASYEANLPSTGSVTTSRFNSQLPFSHNFDGFEDISLVVGGFNGQVGEFLLILEGMAVTSADGTGATAGDPFSLRLTPNIVNAGQDAVVYMIGTDTTVDPLVNWVNVDSEVILNCDDAGNDSLCAEGSSSLTTSLVSRTRDRTIVPDEFDSMLVLPTTQLRDLDFSEDLFINLLMTSFRQSTTGEYLVAFHIEITEENSNGADF